METEQERGKKYDTYEYDNMLRFVSYDYQVDILRNLEPTSILEIGVGNKTTTSYQKNHGFKIHIYDIDENLEPDCVGDIRDLLLENSTYDAVADFEIFEHIPWDDLDQAFNELYHVSKKYVVISIPYSSADFEIIITFPFIKRIFNRRFLDNFFRIPFLKRKGKLWSPSHHWEMGRKGYPPKKIRRILEQYFKIVEEIMPALITGHYYFNFRKDIAGGGKIER